MTPKLTSTQDQRAGYVRESRRNRLERGLVVLTINLGEWLTREVLGVRSQNDDYPNHTCDAGASFKESRVSNRRRTGTAREVTYNAPTVNEIAKPTFFAPETCNLQIMGSGRKRTVRMVSVLIMPHAK